MQKKSYGWLFADYQEIVDWLFKKWLIIGFADYLQINRLIFSLRLMDCQPFLSIKAQRTIFPCKVK